MRRLAALLIVLTLLGGCVSASRPAAASAADAPPRRCSPADPDHWAWFCVVGQILYGAAAFFQPVNELSPR
ncbi:MAG TPA: hypothetical protein VFZ82_20225 [Methylomirabilota bacterium]|nr:hypothetical protein [Methylomirabilota bacterium]